MKKILYGVSFTFIATAAVLVACTKHENTRVQTQKTETTSAIFEKSTLTDAALIDIIKGNNLSYTKLEEIEDLLFSNSQLSSSVLRTMIDEGKYPDYMIEEMMILSAPVSTADLSYLHSVRPALSTTSIIAAASVNILNSGFIVINDNPRQLMFAENMVRKSACPGGCGESEIKGDNFAIITLTSTTIPLDPAEMKPCESGGKWICGTRKRVRLTGTDGTTATYSVTCTQSADKCIRDVESAMSNY